ncbi:hypothetical protein B5M47_01900 [candidate division CPR3 bacterium 4484_211]|uniref:DUF4129 domain-containing protein n=1 Tax=candidate division CPR3 bacterium 4484_211 TaxID=1968527 RepID=A0A1W9NZY5_UNCC3|nr:MAG: hypothetical protein B5M47_01900 [candidate division CPR3 bacterium 4484_211]
MKLEFVLAVLVLIYLLGYTFFPNYVHVDKYTLALIALLFLLAILPTLSSGSISYLFSFKRSLRAAQEAVEKVTGKKESAGDASWDKRGAYFTTARLKEQLRWQLAKLQIKKLKKEERIEPSDALRLAVHLKYQKVIAEPVYEAIERVVHLCDIVDYDSKLTPEEIQRLVNLSVPLIESLSKS